MEKDLDKMINRIENELAALPEQEVVTRQEDGQELHYLVTKKDGECTYEQIPDESVESTISRVTKIETLRKEFEEIKKEIDESICRTDVVTGDDLREKIKNVNGFKKRECFAKIQEYIYGDTRTRVFILYGLRRTGKTTLMYQTIAEMNDETFAKAAFMPVKIGNTLTDVEHDLKALRKRGYKYVFIDEATYMDDFIKGAAVLSDTYTEYGMKIILSGTDSLGFNITATEQLYDRCILQHTTFISYREFENLLGFYGKKVEIDDYLRYGGMLSESGTLYNGPDSDMNDYVNSAIALNIQHSLKNYNGDGRFSNLADLYKNNELTSAINRIVENMTHKFTVDVLTDDFKSGDLELSAKALKSDRLVPHNDLDAVDKKAVNKNLKEMLNILNKNEQTVNISSAHVEEIEDYLKRLDVIDYIDCEILPNKSGTPQHVTVITQPGLRYAQADALIESLLKDEAFDGIEPDRKTYIQNRIRSEICGRMMEEAILLETKQSNPDKHVFKFRDRDAEVDMVVSNGDTPRTCRIYEIKHSDKRDANQCRYLTDPETCSKIERLGGKIIAKYVIYRGEPTVENGVSYLNVEEYLKNLKPAEDRPKG